MAVETLTQGNFAEKTGSGVVLIDFWAPWCGPCKMLGPVVDQIADEMAGKVTVGKINCDDEPQLAQQFNIRSIPAVFVLKDGEVVEQFVGIKPKEVLVEAVEKALA